MSYKVLDFSASFNGSQGNQVLDGQDYYIRNMEGSGNQYDVVNERYRNEANPGNGHEYRASRGGTQSNSTRLSDYYIQNGSFFRCTNITLGVNLSRVPFTKKAGISGLRFYTSIDNAFTITKYLGYNPEVDFNNGSNLTQVSESVLIIYQNKKNKYAQNTFNNSWTYFHCLSWCLQKRFS